MSNGIPGDAERPPQFRSIGQELGAGITDVVTIGRVWAGAKGVALEVIAGIIGYILEYAAKLAVFLAERISSGEERASSAFGRLAATAIEDLLGVRVDPGSFGARGDRSRRTGASDQIGKAVLNALVNTSAGVEPSQEPTTRYLTFVTQLALEGWLEGWILEWLSSAGGFLQGIETFAELDDIIANVLGLGRITRSVLRPYVDALVVTPAEWQVNKTYRPRLLTPSEAVRQFRLGRWERGQLDEELARQGYSQERIEALISANRRSLTKAEILSGLQLGAWDDGFAREALLEEGYDDQTAQRILGLELLERYDRWGRRFADVTVDAYARGDLTDPELDSQLGASIDNVEERQRYRALARLRREVRAVDLSAAQLEAAVKRNVIPTSAYRDGLRRLGYTPEAVSTLELLLRDELNDATEAQRARERREAERAAAEAARRVAAEARRLALEAERAVTEPSLGDVRKAVVRGLVSLPDYRAFLEAERYASDTIAFMVSLVEEDRAAHVADQERRAELAARLERAALPIGQLERAVERGLLSPGEYRGQLVDRAVPTGDVVLLVALAEDRRAARVDAERRRAEAAAAAATRGVSLAQFERAVLRGVRTVADYRAELERQGVGGADQAVIVDWLVRELDDRHAADERRERIARELATKRLSLSQVERAVLRGVRSVAEYGAFLTSQGYELADVHALRALLEAELAEAVAARERRAQIARDQAQRPLALAQLEQLVVAELLTLEQYRAYVARLGYDQADQDRLVALAILEVQEATAARARRQAGPAPPAPPTVTRVQLERAVRAGVASIEDYRALLAREGYEAADRELLATLLDTEAAAAAAARARRADLDREPGDRQLTLGQLERAVRAGELAMGEYVTRVRALDYDEADVAILTATLIAQLEAAAARESAV